MGFQEDLIKSLEEKRRFEEELKMANKKIKLLNFQLDKAKDKAINNADGVTYYTDKLRMLEKELEESKEKNKNYMEANEQLEDDYRIARNEIALLNSVNEELKERLEFNKRKFEEYFSLWKDSSKDKSDLENKIMVLTNDKTKLEDQVKFHKQKYDMAIATPTPTADFEKEIKQLKDKLVLWKKDAEKSKEEAQKFREQSIKEANMKEKYSYELEVMASFYEVEKERAKKAEAEYEQLKRDFEDEVSASKTLKSIMNSKESEIRKLKDEVKKWKNAYSEEVQRPVEPYSSAISEGYIATGTLEVKEGFKLAEVFAVMKHNAEDPELFSNPTEAIQRTEQLNQEKDAYNIRTIRILKVK